MTTLSDIARTIILRGLEIEAIKLNPTQPFKWASGYYMPIYNDNRRFLFEPSDRRLIREGFVRLIEKHELRCHVIAGTSTSGIGPGYGVADELGLPFVYVRDKNKAHGLENRIEGIDPEDDLFGKLVIQLEDLISTGGSSAKSVQGVRDAKGHCDYCIAIFDYGLDKARKIFSGEESFDSKDPAKPKLDPGCNTLSIITYAQLIEVVKEKEYFDSGQIKLLEEWREDPFGWGDKNGFPKAA